MEIDPALLQPRVRELFYSSACVCGAFVVGATTQPRSCIAAPVWAGLVYYQLPRPTLWWAFTCDVHVAHLHAPRRLLDRDRAELARRREHRELALAGRPYEPVNALATGYSAKQPLIRAVNQSRLAT